ncbi:hypothetical protein GQ54DRAFT_297577 [Martensiomyces pterosporus]|nr:hypothetical protein GQ54DRAFT_297577 [Martensiomyces pterosporus]
MYTLSHTTDPGSNNSLMAPTQQQGSKRKVPSASAPAGERAIPLLRSCERCRRRKQRCDGEQPICGRCKGHNAECKYRQSGRFRKRFPKSATAATGKRAADVADMASTMTAAATLSAMSLPAQQPLNQSAGVNPPAFSYGSGATMLSSQTGVSAMRIAKSLPTIPELPLSAGMRANGLATAADRHFQPHRQQMSSSHTHFSLPELSPASAYTSSPDTGLLRTPASGIGYSTASSGIMANSSYCAAPVPDIAPASAGFGSVWPSSSSSSLPTSANINPVEVLKTRCLPDLTQQEGLSESILTTMYELIGKTDDADLVPSNGLDSPGPSDLGGVDGSCVGELLPNPDLLDPRNTARNCTSNKFGIPDHRWSTLNTDKATSSARLSAASSPLSYEIPNINAKTSGTTGTRILQDDSQGLSNSEDPPQALIGLAQRHSLHEPPQTLHAMLRVSFIDSGMKIRFRQFWATLEAGNISDFVMLAYLAIAAHEAQFSNKIKLRHPQKPLEFVCFEAAKREWDQGRVQVNTGVIFALLVLSEYEYQTGRLASMWEFACHAVQSVKKIEFRGARFPWKGTRQAACDVEYEHLLLAFWGSWARLFTAAQALTRRLDPIGEDEMPDFPLHDMCHYTAQPAVTEGVTSVDMVEFPPAECKHSREYSYSGATYQCYLMMLQLHNHYIDLLEKKATAESYFDTLRVWGESLRCWRATWPKSWDLQMEGVVEKARRINEDKFQNRVPLDGNFSHLRREAEKAAQAAAALTTRANDQAKPGKSGRADSANSSPTIADPSLVPSAETSAAASIHLRNVGHHLYNSKVSAEDTWLVILYVMFEMARLRAHRIALVFLHSEEYHPLHGTHMATGIFSSPSLPCVPDDYRFVSDDPMRDSIVFHRSRFECLDAARNLQNLFTMADLMGYPLDRMGIWVVFVIEHAVCVQCSRMRSSDINSQRDALKRLARLLRQLLTLKRWTGALYVFTSVVKTYVDKSHTIEGGEKDARRHAKLVEDSPWPQDHILMMLMREMKMSLKEFCAYTLPVAYASLHTTKVLPPSMRMRIAALIS